MAASKIAIVGGADPERNDPQRSDSYKPKVHIEAANAIAQALGAELAKRGHSIIVYHSGAAYIEAEVVKGFANAAPRNERSIIVRQPQMGTPAIFQEEKTHPKLFRRIVDTSDLWEVSFYRSLADSDGVILIGGGGVDFQRGTNRHRSAHPDSGFGTNRRCGKQGVEVAFSRGRFANLR
jgi:hypothetical protein